MTNGEDEKRSATVYSFSTCHQKSVKILPVSYPENFKREALLSTTSLSPLNREKIKNQIQKRNNDFSYGFKNFQDTNPKSKDEAL